MKRVNKDREISIIIFRRLFDERRERISRILKLASRAPVEFQKGDEVERFFPQKEKLKGEWKKGFIVLELTKQLITTRRVSDNKVFVDHVVNIRRDLAAKPEVDVVDSGVDENFVPNLIPLTDVDVVPKTKEKKVVENPYKKTYLTTAEDRKARGRERGRERDESPSRM